MCNNLIRNYHIGFDFQCRGSIIVIFLKMYSQAAGHKGDEEGWKNV
jgi:hypothetical protein